MKVGVLKEIKVLENRVCMVPSGVATMIANGLEVIVETNAGAGAGFPDDQYIEAGASVATSPADARTFTAALTNATLPYAVEIANKGWKKAMQENDEIKSGANVINGLVTYKAVADAFGYEYTPIEELLN